MDAFENAAEWSAGFEAGWLEHVKRTGTIDWKQYRYIRHQTSVAGPAVDPSSAKLLLVSTAGAYLPHGQEPFDAASHYGDYTVRRIPTATSLDDLDYAHDHYDHAARREDPRVNLPLPYLADMVKAGELGGLGDELVSFSGYQPDAGAVMRGIVPEVLAAADREAVDAALLVPV